MLITLEGVNGVGKTTVGEYVAKELGCEFVRLPQPGPIRDVLTGSKLSQYEKFYLYLADMAKFYAELDPSKNYIMDRSFLSTLVYQIEDGVPEQLILECINSSGFYVDAVVYFDCSPEIAMERRAADRSKDGGNPGGFSTGGLVYYQNIMDSYKEWVTKYCFTVIDAEQPLDVVSAKCLEAVRDLLG